VSLLDDEVLGAEKMKDMGGVTVGGFSGLTARVLICKVCVSADWALDVGLLILPERVIDGGIG
jgi:hypothetical protein